MNIINWFNSSEVRKEIMKIINARINDAEEIFKDGMVDIKDQLFIDLQVAKDNAEEKTELLLKNVVKTVIGDLLK